MKIAMLLLLVPLSCWADITRGVSEVGVSKMMEMLRHNPAQWNRVTEGIAHGEARWLNVVPLIGASGNEKETGELMNALSFALIADPASALKGLKAIDGRIAQGVRELAPYGSDAACALPMTLDYTRQATVAYYHQATRSLAQAGAAGAECLALMNAAMAEINDEEKRGIMHWGHKTWP